MNDLLSRINLIINIWVFRYVMIPLLIFLLFMLLRRVFASIVLRFILNLAKKTKSDVDDFLLKALKTPVQYFFIVLGLFIALRYVPNIAIIHQVTITRIFESSIIILVFWFLYLISDTSSLIFENLIKKINIKLDYIVIRFLSNFFRIVIIMLAIIMVLQRWGFEVNGFIAGLGLGGLGFALASKDVIANIFGGLVIMGEKPFSIGDRIQTSNLEGIIEDIGLRSTKLRTLDNALVLVPNSIFSNEPITNWSRMEKRRVTFNLGLTYSTSYEQLIECVSCIKDMLENHKGIHSDSVFVNFDNFGDSSLNIYISFFTITTEWKNWLDIKQEVNLSIIKILDDKGVGIAFPSRSVYIQSDEQDTP